jgi:hypothetical protein
VTATLEVAAAGGAAAPARARLVTRPLLVRFVSIVGTATSFMPGVVRAPKPLAHGAEAFRGAGKNHAMNTASVSTLLNTARRTG